MCPPGNAQSFFAAFGASSRIKPFPGRRLIRRLIKIHRPHSPKTVEHLVIHGVAARNPSDSKNRSQNQNRNQQIPVPAVFHSRMVSFLASHYTSIKPMSNRSCKAILASLIIGYMVIFGTLTALRHANFETQAWDLGIFEQTLWNTAHGRILQNTIEEIPHHLGIHMSPFLFLLVPGFLLFPSPYYLLIIQTIILAAGAIPAYLLAHRLLRSTRWGLFFAALYLLYPPLPR